VFVQALISQPAVEALDIGVLIRLARFYQPQLDPLPMRPHHHRLPRELRAVVRADHLRLAPQRTDRIEHARQVLTAHRVLHGHRDHLVRRVIDHRQALERTSGSDAIEHEVHRPHLVRQRRTQQRMTLRRDELLATPTPDMQLLEPVKPLHALVVHQFGSLPELQVNHPHPVPSMALRQRYDLRP
jgi:hypothetical protein